MKTEVYKYYAGLTSQLPFCATPLRLDSYNNCSFGCAYCFARTRQGHGRELPLQISNPENLKARLLRVSNGIINSALDEFISRRIPFQLGGMSDPFSKFELKTGTSLKMMEILKEYNYPYIISTKSNLVCSSSYTELLEGADCYVRFSTTVIDDENRNQIDRNCSPITALLKASEILNTKKIPTSFRLQPIIPGYEKNASQMISDISNSGAKHISAEYLKVPIDANLKFGKHLINIMDGGPVKNYMNLGSKKMGREISLPLKYRATYLSEMYLTAKEKGLTFGFADNDLLIHSDGSSCCGAADLYLKGATFFTANVAGVIKKKEHGEKIFFTDLLKSWLPEERISSYLNSKARIITLSNDGGEWLQYLREIWSGNLGIYTPDFFDGVISANTKDEFGMPIFIREKSSFEEMLNKAV